MSGQLGCATTYRAVITTADGRRRVVVLDTVSDCTWERQRNTPSSAAVAIIKAAAGATCCGVLGRVRPWTHEIALYRDSALVWSGPITRITEHRDTFNIDARDVMAWMGKRTNASTHKWGLQPAEDPGGVGTTVDAAVIAQDLLLDGFGQHDPNVITNLQINPTPVRVRREITNTDSTLIMSQIEDLTKVGLTYTTVGRRIVIASTAAPVYGVMGVLDTEHILGDVQLVYDGDEWVTRSVVIGEGVKGVAGGTDGFYGLLTELVKVDGSLSQTSAQQEAVRRVQDHGTGSPMIYLPDDVRLSPYAPVQVSELVCGVGIDVVTTGFCAPIRQPMRLQRMTCRWNASGENIGVSLAAQIKNPVKTAPESLALSLVLRDQQRQLTRLQQPLTLQIAGTHRFETDAAGVIWVVHTDSGTRKAIFTPGP